MPTPLTEPYFPMLEVTANPYFHVILAGLQGGGRYLTGLREHIGPRGYVVPSISTRAGLKKGENRLKTHYTNLAAKLVQQAQGHTIRVYAHSLGGIEVLDLMKALVARPDLPHKTLEILFISPPGIGQRGFGGMREIGRRFGTLLKNLGLYDQYYLLPSTDEQNEKLRLKRQVFWEEWFPRLIPDPIRRDRVEKAIQLIDAELLLLQDYPELQREFETWYLKQRHNIMKGLLNKVFSGSHIEEERHFRYLGRYSERSEDIASKRAYFPCLFSFTFNAFKTVYQGLDTKIMEVFKTCQKLGIDAKLGIVVLGHDDLVQIQDYDGLNKLSAVHAIPISRHIFKDEEHASVAHKWELIDALEAIHWNSDKVLVSPLQTLT